MILDNTLFVAMGHVDEPINFGLFDMMMNCLD
jgi:hypothetical protein